jgi:hypothetical protein
MHLELLKMYLQVPVLPGECVCVCVCVLLFFCIFIVVESLITKPEKCILNFKDVSSSTCSTWKIFFFLLFFHQCSVFKSATEQKKITTYTWCDEWIYLSFVLFCFLQSLTTKLKGWDLVEWLERCASIPKITSSNLSSGGELTFCSDLLLTARGGSTWALFEFACLPCYPGNTLCSQRVESPGRAG